MGLGEEVAARAVDLAVERHHDGHRREGLGEFPFGTVDGLDHGGQAGGQGDDLVARLEHAARDAPGEAPEIVVRVVVGPDHGLDREARVDVVQVAADVDRLEGVEQRAALIPRGAGGFLDHVVAVEGGDGDELDVRDAEAGGELGIMRDDLVETRLGEIDQVHLVHRDHDVRDAEQGGDEGVAAGLLDHALARVDQDDGEVGGRGARHHVAGVLDVAGGVGDDELAPRRGEIAVGDVDGDALLALGAQTVGQEGEVEVLLAPLLGDALEVFQGVLEDGLRVVEQAADEGGLAVVHGAGGGEAQEVHGEVMLVGVNVGGSGGGGHDLETGIKREDAKSLRSENEE